MRYTYTRSLFLILSFLLFSYNCSADDKIVIGVVPFTGSVIPRNLRDEIVSYVTQSFIETKRFIVVDRTKMEQVDKERKLQKSEDFIDGKVVEQGKSLGAQYLITGDVDQYSNDGEVCKLSFTINVVDVATGQIINTTTINTKKGGHFKRVGRVGLFAGGLAVASRAPVVGYAAAATGAGALNNNSDGYGMQPNKVFEKSLQEISPQIEDFVETNFPATYTVVRVERKDDKGRATSLLIAGGKSTGLEEGQRLKIVELTDVEVDGKKITRHHEIGIMKVTNVEDENFSTGVITDETDGLDESLKEKKHVVAMTFTE